MCPSRASELMFFSQYDAPTGGGEDQLVLRRGSRGRTEIDDDVNSDVVRSCEDLSTVVSEVERQRDWRSERERTSLLKSWVL